MSYLPEDYVPVHERVAKFHDKYPAGSITTQYEFVGDDTVVFQATIQIDKQVFTGTAFGSIKRDKALEKIETVAVGRALAFAGFETQDGLASKEEMEKFTDNKTEEDNKPRFSDEDFDNWVDSDKTDKPKNAKEMRKFFKVSKEMAKRIDNFNSK